MDSRGCTEAQAREDDDEDGVPNLDDACPSSPPDITVGEDGCGEAERDVDGDGIPDVLDACDDTPFGAAIDATGCTRAGVDSDGDGYDDLYRFDLNSTTGLRENQTGDAFPADARQWSDVDGDGFGDNQSATGADDCPEVPGSSNEATVFGCIDRDQDGWADLIDALPDESTQWSDEDSDGYGDEANGNASDACPGTPIGVEVDDRGCSAKTTGYGWRWDLRCLRSVSERSTGAEHGSRTRLPTGGGGLRRRFVRLTSSLPVTLGAAGGGVLIVVLVIVVLRLRAREDDEEDWYGDDYEEDEDEEDEAPLSFLDRNPRRTPEPAPRSSTQVRGPTNGPMAGPSTGPTIVPSSGPTTAPPQRSAPQHANPPNRTPMTNPVNSQPRSPVPTTFDPAPMSMSLAETLHHCPSAERREARNRLWHAAQWWQSMCSRASHRLTSNLHSIGFAPHMQMVTPNDRCSSNSNPRVGALINQGNSSSESRIDGPTSQEDDTKGAAWWTRSMERSSPEGIEVDEAAAYFGSTDSSDILEELSALPLEEALTIFFDRLSDLLLKPGEFDFEILQGLAWGARAVRSTTSFQDPWV